MQNVVRVLTQIVYVLEGVLALLAGIVALLPGTGLLPEALRDLVFEFGAYDPQGIHMVQEMATFYILVGVMLLWFARHYAQSMRFHWLMTGWALLLFWVHWFRADGSFNNDLHVIVDAIPFVVFLALGLLRRQASQAPGATA
jgi:hypothetical protein